MALPKKKRARTEPIPAELPLLQRFSREHRTVAPVALPSTPDPYRRPIAGDEWRRAMSELRRQAPQTDRQRESFLARAIAEGLLWLDEVMDRYCAATCHACADPCCAADGIFYDRADLIYLLGLNADLPAGQIRERAGEPCRFLSPEGCLLPRICRPFICVWYLCEPQMALFHGEPVAAQKRFIAVLQAVRHCRQQLLALHDKALTRDVA